MTDKDTERHSYNFLMKLRKSWLEQVDAVERELDISPRTAEIRQWWRDRGRSCASDQRSALTNT